MDKEILQIPGMITKDKSLLHGARQFVFDSQENIDVENLKILMDMENKLGWITFAMRKIQPMDLIDLPPLDETKLDLKKSPSMRLRNTMYVYFEKTGGKKDLFDLWYCREMEKMINHYKDKIQE